jgi:hypothetical protein
MGDLSKAISELFSTNPFNNKYFNLGKTFWVYRFSAGLQLIEIIGP